MKVEFNRYKMLQLRTDEFDLCRTCINVGKCPLVKTLKDNIAVLRIENLRMDKCKLYEQRKRA